MNYTSAMVAILQLDQGIYPAVHHAGKAVNYCMINILVFGLLHSMSALYFAEAFASVGEAGQTIPWALKLQVMAVAVGVAFLMHAGAALFLWVFSRGFGGRTAFLPVYLNLGLGLIALWPMAPALAALQTGVRGVALQGFFILAALYGLCVIFIATKSASGLSTLRMAVAMVVTIVVAVSIVYLWT